MNKEYLLNYQKKEYEDINRFYKKVRNGNFSINDTYPPRKRFRKLRDPVGTNAYHESIWPQIPLFGSLVVCLHPVREDQFQKFFGFSVDDLDKLIDFCKDTGKIQFAIGAPATNFEGLEYLDAVFEELNPPGIAPIPLDVYGSREEIKECVIEFYTLADINFKRKIYEWGTSEGFSIGKLNKAYEDYCVDYIVLKLLGFNDEIEIIKDLLISNPLEVVNYFNLYATLIVNPKIMSFRAIENFGLDELKGLLIKSDQNNIKEYKLPCEIGNFIINKLTAYPEGFEACKDVIGKYDQEDLYLLMDSLNTGVKLNNADLINKTKQDISEIIDNIWDDANIKSKKFFTKMTLSMGIAIIGELAGKIISPGLGILASLGFNLVDELISEKSESISTKITKLFIPNHLCVVYDFKNKYNIPENA